MSRPVMMTHGDRRYRREKAVQALAAGERTRIVALRLGLSEYTVREAGRRAGLRRKMGRPPNEE